MCFFALITLEIQAKSYLSQQAFVELVSKQFKHVNFDNKTLWLNKNIQSNLKSILNHNYPKLRLRYKIDLTKESTTTLWFLDEIGKEKPISFAIAVSENKIQLIRVLEFRESRGYEIHIPAFAQQFEQLGINNQGSLDKTIDGITGATMSVNAMKKVSRVAIYLHQLVLGKNDQQ